MIGRVLVDTGPLIALIDHRDQHHAWVRSQFDGIEPPLLTCEAVLTEACHLARRTDGGTQAALDLFERGVARLAFDLDENFAHVSSLMRRYANVPMSLADACLVRMSELVAGCVVFTLDSDFRIYRRHGRQKIPLVIPPDR
ncbi:MAG TPA: PIN domain-containing protein [Gemmataceae bacterium]|nr:PIN domain-containing protein [Gemmataceae bacterium]